MLKMLWQEAKNTVRFILSIEPIQYQSAKGPGIIDENVPITIKKN